MLDLLAQESGHFPGLGRDGGLLFNGSQQWTNLAKSPAGDHTELSGMAAERVGHLSSLTNQGFAHLQNHALGLLRDGLHGHEVHARPPRRFADRFSIVTVVLAAFDIGFDVLRWNKTYLMAERGQFASPMMRATTGF